MTLVKANPPRPAANEARMRPRKRGQKKMGPTAKPRPVPTLAKANVRGMRISSGLIYAFFKIELITAAGMNPPGMRPTAVSTLS